MKTELILACGGTVVVEVSEEYPSRRADHSAFIEAVKEVIREKLVHCGTTIWTAEEYAAMREQEHQEMLQRFRAYIAGRRAAGYDIEIKREPYEGKKGCWHSIVYFNGVRICLNYVNERWRKN